MSGEMITGIGWISVVFYHGVANLANGFGFIQRLCLLILFEPKTRPYISLQTWRGVDYLLLSSCLLLFWSTFSSSFYNGQLTFLKTLPLLFIKSIKFRFSTLRLIDMWVVLGLIFHPFLSYVLLNYPLRLTWVLGSTIVHVKLVQSDQKSLYVGRVDDSRVTTVRIVTDQIRKQVPEQLGSRSP